MARRSTLRRLVPALAVAALLALVALPQLRSEIAPDEVASQRLEERARGGDTAAQYALASKLLAEWRSRQAADGAPPEALYWLSRAAEGGHAEAMRRLGGMLVEGRGVDADPELGRRWLALARSNA